MGFSRHRARADSHHAVSKQSTTSRRFLPEEHYRKNIKLEDVEVRYDEDLIFVACNEDEACSDCGSMSAHIDCVIIAVDGACRNNGTSKARAAVGVFAGRESPFNDIFVLNVPNPTNQVAELRAGISGLEQALRICDEGLDGGISLNQVIIKADSEYLVKGITEWVFKWEGNGYRTSKGLPVVNALLFKELQELVSKLNDHNVEVLFWHVPREYNREADMLANAALRRLEDSLFD